MCIVIDTNAISSLLNPNASDHQEFQPILAWIDTHTAKIVYGGKKYKRELGKMPKYYAILVEMRRAGKVHEADDVSVDRVEQEINQTTPAHRNFNDQAIVAIVIVSHCRLICSKDRSSFPFLTSPTLYRPRHIKCPKIYRGSRNADLLYRRDILGHCGPCCIHT